MTAKIIDGTAISKAIRQEIETEVKKLTAKGLRAPCLAVILAGDDPASHVYVGHKEKACQAAGILSKTIRLTKDTTQAELMGHIESLNNDPEVDGILVQLPLPKQLDKVAALQAISPEKDVDGLGYVNQGLLNWNLPGHYPCTPAGVVELLKREKIQISGKVAAVIGRSVLVGLPVATLLMHEGATVIKMHSKTQEPKSLCKLADIVVVATGVRHLVDGSWIKPGAAIIDVGMHRLESGKLTGDVDFDSVAKVAGAITPVPGGVGPMTIAMLLLNTLRARQNK